MTTSYARRISHRSRAVSSRRCPGPVGSATPASSWQRRDRAGDGPRSIQRNPGDRIRYIRSATPRGYQLLAAVDVVRGAGQRGVLHEVDGQGGDVGRPDDATDRQRRAEILAAPVEVVAEQPGRQGCVDESGGDHVDPDRGEF